MIRRDDTGAEIRAVIIAIRIRGGEFRPNAVDRSGGFCCQVPPNPAWTLLRRPGLQAWFFKPLTRPEQPEHSCHSQLHNWPDNGGTMPSKSAPFTPSSILFRPRRCSPEVRTLVRTTPTSRMGRSQVSCTGGGAGYCPRVRKVYY